MFMYIKYRCFVNYNICIIFVIFCNCVCLMCDFKGCWSLDLFIGKFKFINLLKWILEFFGK